MRSSTIILSCGAALSASMGGAVAAPIAGIIDGIIPVSIILTYFLPRLDNT